MFNIINSIKKKFLIICLFLFLFIAIIPLNMQAKILYPILNAKSNLLMDADSGIIYISDNIDEQLGIASLTKLMSMYVVFDEMKKQDLTVDDTVTISNKVASLKSQNFNISGVWYEPGQEMTMGELIDLSLVYSDNGAIVALAEKVSGSEAAHVEKMNEKAKKLGMNSTQFYNTSGLTMVDYGDYIIEGTSKDDYNVSTARNMGLLCLNLLKDYPQILDVTSKTSLEYKGEEYFTYNQLLEGQPLEYKGVKGLKTGTSNEAGECYIGYLETEDINYISVVLDAPSTDNTNRYLETITMYDWAKEQRYSTLYSSDEVLFTQKIAGAGNSSDFYVDDIKVLTSDKIYLNLKDFTYNSKYIDKNGYLIRNIPKDAVVATVSFDTPEDSINLQTVFNKENELKVTIRNSEPIYKQDKISKFFSSFNIFLSKVFD